MEGKHHSSDSRLTRRQRHVAILLAVVCIVAIPAGLTAAQTQVGGGGDPYNISFINDTGRTVDTGAESYGVEVSSDGMKMLVLAQESGEVSVHEYNVSSPFNLTTATRVDIHELPEVSDSSISFAVGDEGRYIYVIEQASDDIIQYELGDEWDASTEQLVREENVDGGPVHISFGDGGVVMGVINDSDPRGLDMFELSDPWNVSSLSRTGGEQFSYSNVDGFEYSNGDCYIGDRDTETIYQYQGLGCENLNATSTDGYVFDGLGFDWGNGYRFYESSQGVIRQFNVGDVEFFPPFDGRVKINANNYMRPNTTQHYSVTVNGQDVTEDVTLNTSDSTVLTVYESNNTLAATGDTNLTPATVTLNTTYQGVTASKDVTVANPSVENLDLLPTWWKVNATVGDGMMLWLIVATLAAVVATRAATSFAGVGAYVMFMTGGWMTGSVSDGVMVAVILTGLFLGMNLAANVDTTIRGSG